MARRTSLPRPISDGARAGCGSAPAHLPDRHRHRRLLGFHRSTHHDWRETWRGEHRCRVRYRMAPGPVAALLLPIFLIGIGIGVCWAFIAQRIMTGAKHGEENIAAASVATVQQT